jgi:hypothetical protein
MTVSAARRTGYDAGMEEPKKRPRFLVIACAAALVIAAIVLGFIETVGRRGTIVGRSTRVTLGMPLAEVLRIFGPAECSAEKELIWYESDLGFLVEFDRNNRVSAFFISKFIRPWPIPQRQFWEKTVWHLRRWAEHAWTAIHGPLTAARKASEPFVEQEATKRRKKGS